MFGRIVAVAVNTFREAVRDQVLYGVLWVALGVLLFTLALAELSLNQHIRIVLDIGLASISIFSVVVAIFLGSSLLYKEIERKTLYVVLPKPLRRAEFLVGKFAGIALTVAVFVLLMGAVQLWVAAVQLGGFSWKLLIAAVGLPVVWALGAWRSRDRTPWLVPWAAGTLAVCATLASQAGVQLTPVLAALVLNLGEVWVLTAVALLFSAFSTPFLTALFTAGVWLAGRAADRMVTMKADMLPDEIRVLLGWVAEVVPNFNLFVPGRHALGGLEGSAPVAYVANVMGYAGLYTALTLAVAAFLFQRRDFL